MKRLALLFWLHLKSLARPGTILVFVILAPLLLGFIAGYGNKMNYSEEINIALVDLDQSEESEALTNDLRSRGWLLQEADEDAAGHLLAMGSVGAIIRIGDGYDDFIAGRSEQADIGFTQTDQSLLQVTIRQSVMLYAESRRTIEQMKQTVIDYRVDNGDSIEGLDEELAELLDYYRENEGAMPIHYENRPTGPLRRTIVVGDFTLEVLYLAVLAVMAATSAKPLRKRLLALPDAPALSLLMSYLVWLGLGFLQIALFTGAIALAMGQTGMLLMVFPLLTYFALVLALAFWLKHLEPDIGLYLGLFLTFLLSLFGGVFFPLPGPLLTRFARYTPLGWIYAYQAGMADLPIWSIWLSAALILVLLIRSFSRPTRRS